MAKTDYNITVGGKTISGEEFEKRTKVLSQQQEEELKPVIITSAAIKEGLCNYSYEVNIGKCKGDKITRKGSLIIHEDMASAFSGLNVHLAILDDAFKHSGEMTLIQYAGHDITNNFRVTGFKIQGNDENEGFVLVGEKWVTNGSISLETPKISKSSNYVFFEELQEAIEGAREEVELYMDGKSEPQYEQTSMEFPDGEDEFSNPLN